MRILRVQEDHKVLCPKTGKMVPAYGKSGKHCSDYEFYGNVLSEGCEHYLYVPTEEFLKEQGMGKEHLEGESTHVVCGYGGPMHPDWEELGLRRDWGILRENISEEERLKIIKESGTDNPKPRTKLSINNELNPNQPTKENVKARGRELERQVLENLGWEGMNIGSARLNR